MQPNFSAKRYLLPRRHHPKARPPFVAHSVGFDPSAMQCIGHFAQPRSLDTLAVTQGGDELVREERNIRFNSHSHFSFDGEYDDRYLASEIFKNSLISIC
ncbi:MAG: hypothetical protein Q8R51_07905 [Azonexus sp.]|nr:hypothetical protein [Azonexus sp.]